MHVQTKSGGKKQTTLVNATNKRVCFRIEPRYPTSESNLKIGKDNCKRVVEAFKKLSGLLINDEIKVNCWENKKMKCKKCYCVCCNVQMESPRISSTARPMS
jgi:hypothetical protein